MIELFSDCITNRMMIRSDHRRGKTVRKISVGLRTATPSHSRMRLGGDPPSVKAVVSSPIALLPLP